jgi:hypothetical protein
VAELTLPGRAGGRSGGKGGSAVVLFVLVVGLLGTTCPADALELSAIMETMLE